MVVVGLIVVGLVLSGVVGVLLMLTVQECVGAGGAWMVCWFS